MWEPKWDGETIKSEQERDESCRRLAEQVPEDQNEGDKQETKDYFIYRDGILYKTGTEISKDKLIAPRTLIRKILRDFHDNPIVDHRGRQKIYQLIKSRFYLSNMKNEIEKYCDTCESCNSRKTSPHHKKVPLQRFTSVTEPWELASMDIVGPLVSSWNENKYLPSYQDNFTKYAGAIPLQNQKGVAGAFVENITTRHGTPKKLLVQGSMQTEN